MISNNIIDLKIMIKCLRIIVDNHWLCKKENLYDLFEHFYGAHFFHFITFIIQNTGGFCFEFSVMVSSHQIKKRLCDSKFFEAFSEYTTVVVNS